jgi:selenocysteine-specific elongation factor
LSTRRLAVDVEILPGAPALKHGTRVHVHLGTSVVLGRLILPGREATGDVRALAPGARGTALLRLEAPLPARRGDRLVLRSYSPVTTIGGACVTDPLPPPRMLHSSVMGSEDPGDLVLSRVRERGTFGCPETELPARCGLSAAATQRVIRDLEARGQVVSLGSYWVASEVLPGMGTTLLGLIDAAHASEPHAGGIPRASLRVAAGRRWRPELVDLLLSRLTREGVVTGDDRIARAVAAPVARDPLETRVLEVIDAAGLQGLSLQELEAALPGIDRKGTSTLLARLVKTREVERIADLCVAAPRLKGLVDELRRLAGTGEVPARIEVGWFKERYGLTRRAAIPLLEWLDRTRVTRREGEARVLTGT